MLIRGRSGEQREAEGADAGAGVEDQRLAGGQGQLDAGGVAAVAVHLRPGGRDRTARAPDPDPHPTTSWRPVVTSRRLLLVDRPEDHHRPGGAAGGADDRHRAGRDPVLDRRRRSGPRTRRGPAGPRCSARVSGSSSKGEWLVVVVERAEATRPLGEVELAGVLERAGRSARRPPRCRTAASRRFATRKAGVVTLVRRFRARISSSGFCGPDIGSQHCSTDCAFRHQSGAARQTADQATGRDELRRPERPAGGGLSSSCRS